MAEFPVKGKPPHNVSVPCIAVRWQIAQKLHACMPLKVRTAHTA